MAVVFPASPGTGLIVTDPVTNAAWRWDGTRWVPAASGAAFVPLTGGTMQGPLALAGVTDGSGPSADPGEIGQIVSAGTATDAPLANNVIQDIVTLAIPPGDWIIQGQASMGGAGSTGVNSFFCWISMVSATAPQVIVDPSGYGLSGFAVLGNDQLGYGAYFAMSPIFVSTTTSRTAYLTCLTSYAAGAATAQGVIFAQRRR